MIQPRRALQPGRRPTVASIPRPRPARSLRWLQRLYFRDQPILFVAVPAAIVGAFMILDLLTPLREQIDRYAAGHEVGVALGEHVVVAVLVAATAYYLLFGIKLQRALKKYRQLSGERSELREWSDGKPPLVRRRRVELFADAIARSAQPAVAVVQGRTGTGRTSFILGLVEELASKKLIPVPVWAQRDGSFDVEPAAKEVFCSRIDRSVSSDQQADAIWRRARASHAVVILVDGIDDEVVDKLETDGGSRFRKAIDSLGERRIALVLATTRTLPLGELARIREDLDLFTREEAEEYAKESMAKKRDDLPRAQRAIAAIRRLRDPVDESLVAPFYLELMAALRRPLPEMPANRDLWRATLLGVYLDGLGDGLATPATGAAKLDREELARRGAAARQTACRAAQRIGIEHGELTVECDGLLNGDLRPLRYAVEFGLLWHGAEQVGFAADDLGAYMIGGALDDPGRLIEGVEQLARREDEQRRRDRYVLTALIYWHLRHGEPGRGEVLRDLLQKTQRERWTRPALTAALVRIASACELSECAASIHSCALRCIEAAEELEDDDPRAWHRAELLKLVRALAEWRDPSAHVLLWRLATAQDIDLEWPAAKGLAMASDRPASTLAREIDEKLGQAERRGLRDLSRHDDVLGNEIASLAWILPTLREDAEEQLGRVRALCLDARMSPLRGEMSLAQGLKLAVVNGRCAERNIEEIVELLCAREPDRDPFVRFWHARLILVQALLAHARLNPGSAQELDAKLKALQRREANPLVWRAMSLVRDGLKACQSPSDENWLTRYIWVHEREAVRWVEQDKDDVARLAADAVLLSNMTYQTRRENGRTADRAVELDGLPTCIRRCSQRHRIALGGCSCPYKLCERPKAPATDKRATFSESFCREQVRLAAESGPPPWARFRTFRGRQRLEDFWAEQAEAVHPNARERGRAAPGSVWWRPPRWRPDEAYALTLRHWWRHRRDGEPGEQRGEDLFPLLASTGREDATASRDDLGLPIT
jgi:hypothetical protein